MHQVNIKKSLKSLKNTIIQINFKIDHNYNKKKKQFGCKDKNTMND